MKFNVIRSSDWHGEGELNTIEISCVEELMNLLQVSKASIILHNWEIPTIEIYDDCRE